MNRWKSAGMLLVLIIMTACVTERELNYDEVRGIGGVRIDDILRNYDKFYLPVYCNVTGLEKVTVAPTTMNSALMYRRIKSDIRDDTIFITVVAGLVKGENRTTKCDGVVLDNDMIKFKKYRVVYRNPDKSETFLKEVKVAY